MATEFVLKADGIVRREITETAMPNPDSVIQAMSAGLATYVFNAFAVGGKRVHFRFSQKGVTFAVELDRIVINTDWTTTPSGNFYPTFGRPPTTGALSVSFGFILPCPRGEVFLVWNNQSDVGGLGYLVQVTTDGIYKLALPNTYADAHLCLGHGESAFRGILATRRPGEAYPDFARIVAEYVSLFEQAPWNSDLRPSVSYQDVLEFRPTGLPVEKSTGLFNTGRTVVSNDSYNWLGRVVREVPPPPAPVEPAPVPVAAATAAPAAAPAEVTSEVSPLAER